MFLLWGVTLGVLVGFVRGGKVANLDHMDIRHLWLVSLALVIQLLIFPLFSGSPIISFGTEYLHLLSYLLLAGFVVLNWRVWQIPLMGIGMGLNLLVITLNGGYMPASVRSLKKAGESKIANRLVTEGTYGNVINMDTSTILDPLGDWLYLPSEVPLSNAFSLGDLLIFIGLVLFFGIGMVKNQST